MKKFIPTLLFVVLFTQSPTFSQSPVVQSILEEMSIDSIVFVARELTGDIQTIINGTPYIIQSRHKNQPGNDKAADYIQQKFESFGLEVINQTFSSSGRNVYAIQPGTEFPNQKYIICAHYDDMPSGSTAPGADDNCSGTSGVIEAARVLSQYSFPYTIIYALWDEEEQGLIGSAYFAQNAASQGDSILGVINQDMIAWDSDNDNVANIHTRSVGSSIELKDKMVEVNAVYNIGLEFLIMNPGETYSDHASFWSNGFGSILLIEDDNDFNAFYHTTNDLYTHYNQPYYDKMTKLSAATLATLALNLDMRIAHTPIVSRDNTDDIQTSADIITGLTIGAGVAAPRLYYRLYQGTEWTEFYEVIGTEANINTNYNFTIPGQPLGTIVQYYIAAQDDESSIVTTLPVGGSGFNPPGSTPPAELFQFFVTTTSIAFSDSAMNTDNWAATGNWDITTQKYVSEPTSFTDSPNGEYPNNYNATFTYNGSVNLTEVLGATVEFQTQWDIEADWDYGQFQISTDLGMTWSSMQGLYTNPGTGSFQPSGEPLYDGTQINWVKESIDLSEYIGEQVMFRFLIRSDASVTEDGWYFDDLNVIIYNFIPVEVEEITGIINEYSLEQNYPNPFNPSTIIQWQLPKDNFVTLKVYDLLGNEITTLVSEEKTAGNHQVIFDASVLPSGVYFYTLRAGNFTSTKKMMLTK
jgi:Peptidase family M28/Immune inhibitor A-like, MAM domain/Secretion system C-terminal sorting domain